MGPDPKLKAGKTGNYWCSVDEWPTYTPTHFALTADGGLDDKTTAAPEGQRTYEYDPQHPVPTLGGNNLEVKLLFTVIVAVWSGRLSTLESKLDPKPDAKPDLDDDPDLSFLLGFTPPRSNHAAQSTSGQWKTGVTCCFTPAGE